MQVQIIGSGDAFGSGGRLNTCFHLTGHGVNALIDCGASSLIGLKRLGIDRNAIDAVLVTHFHGDHFGGLPFLLLDAQHVSKRQRPLTIVGPPGLPDRLRAAQEAAFEFSSTKPPRFSLTLRELAARETVEIGALRVTPFAVDHGKSGGPFFAYRIESGGKVLCYSGDTQWTDSLIEAAHEADLFLCECYRFAEPTTAHLDWGTLQRQRPRLTARRLMLTHMSEEMLAHREEAACETAEDGMVIAL